MANQPLLIVCPFDSPHNTAVATNHNNELTSTNATKVQATKCQGNNKPNKPISAEPLPNTLNQSACGGVTARKTCCGGVCTSLTKIGQLNAQNTKLALINPIRLEDQGAAQRKWANKVAK